MTSATISRVINSISLVVILVVTAKSEELWREDVSSKMNLGISASGFRKVSLDCHDKSMSVKIQTDEDFDGVVYTRGNFYVKDPVCFLDARGGRDFEMEIPLDKCGTRLKDNKYTNTLILQHDDELIMPGDAAFTLNCNYGDTYTTAVTSTIALADPDPSGKELPIHLRSKKSGEKSVVFTPADIRKNKSGTGRVVGKEEL